MGKGAGQPTGYVDPRNPGTHTEGADPVGNGGHQVQNEPGAIQQAAEATARANRPNQNTPFGSSGWQYDPSTDTWTQSTKLNDSLSTTADQLEKMLQSSWSTPLDNGDTARRSASDALYGQATSRLDPYWEQQKQAEESMLVNQGFNRGDEAFDKEMGNFYRGRNDAYNQANFSATEGGTQAAMQQQQLDLNSRNAPLFALGGLGGFTGMPGFMPGPDYLGGAEFTSDYNLKNAEMQNQLMASLGSGLFSMGGSALGGWLRRPS